MVEWKKKSRRKATGGINNSVNAKTKSLSDRGGTFSKTVVDDNQKIYKVRTIGGNQKVKIAKAQTAIVSDSTKTVKAKILNVVENSANKHFVRQKVITKGAIIKVEIDGKEQSAKVTSRPGQSGQISAILIK
ncbi:MAG: 30S ribosomal protein S8e [archaeon]|jgi:small subunit ribosomal protein S8e|nr:30S ribosomal protein S8e [archaeon]MDD2477565.1 30S ribosomal protein S8e [Candidatus ainarchaeum sp.]MDD3084339.1 30S ribosomal protein S8e [Candidatus ainarchaeum sp.]MDD4221081.1 30S ribosomal protein S8e [Candidatus ainarchaeum sp.]MDD4662552.1 30S ribosomal protein S8e [Candidatus ainarchaeum sp.]